MVVTDPFVWPVWWLAPSGDLNGSWRFRMTSYCSQARSLVDIAERVLTPLFRWRRQYRSTKCCGRWCSGSRVSSSRMYLCRRIWYFVSSSECLAVIDTKLQGSSEALETLSCVLFLYKSLICLQGLSKHKSNRCLVTKLACQSPHPDWFHLNHSLPKKWSIFWEANIIVNSQYCSFCFRN